VKKDTKRFPLIVLVALAALLSVGVGTGASWFWWVNAIAPTRSQPNPVTLQVPEGSVAEDIGQQLQAAGLIRSMAAWKLWTKVAIARNPAGSFKTGTYELSAQASLPELARSIWTGQVKETRFTIPEGWSMKEMGAYFEQQGWFSAKAFLKATQQVPRDRFPWLPSDAPFLEGYLFPDTYQVPLEMRSPEAVISTMLKRFERQALPLYEQRKNLPDLSLKDWVTLSSVVEKEAVVPEERPVISGVFWNRLHQGITLGSDPTVEYGLGVKQTPDQPLTLAQVKTPSAYNTYINAGLPPTPIASPGFASLKAVLNPKQTDYLYFVARYDGTHVFSKTLADHEQAQSTIRDQQDAKRSSDSGQT
jgi:UPF0755 protein